MKKNNILVLTGSGEFTQAMEETDLYLINLAKIGAGFNNTKKVKVAIIPTAAGRESDYRKWIDMGVAHFANLGALATGFDVVNKKDANNNKLFEKIKEFQLMYFSGGDPGHLFQTLKGSIFWKNIEDNFRSGSILAGASAGAMILGNYVIGNVYQTFENNKDPVWDKAFDFVPFAIIPHFDYVKNKERINYLKMLSKTPLQIKNNLLGVDEDTAIILDFGNDLFEVTGKGSVTVIKNGVKKIFKNKNKYPLNILKKYI